MAEAARRFDDADGSDIVRRLIARPIRTGNIRLQPEPEPEAASGEDAAETDRRDIATLEAELALLKAVLEAERKESASLRARIQAGPDADAAWNETLAVRERWAGLVDDLLLRLR